MSKSLPISYTRGDTGETFAAGSSLVAPTAADVDELAMDGKICGLCKHFSLDEGQARIKMTKFLPQLVHEHNWQVRHLCSHPSELGICGQHEAGYSGPKGSTITGARHTGCDLWKPK